MTGGTGDQTSVAASGGGWAAGLLAWGRGSDSATAARAIAIEKSTSRSWVGRDTPRCYTAGALAQAGQSDKPGRYGMRAKPGSADVSAGPSAHCRRSQTNEAVSPEISVHLLPPVFGSTMAMPPAESGRSPEAIRPRSQARAEAAHEAVPATRGSRWGHRCRLKHHVLQPVHPNLQRRVAPEVRLAQPTFLSDYPHRFPQKKLHP